MRTLISLTVLLAGLTAGCALRPVEGDRLFAANRLEEAEVAYREYLRGRQSTARGQEALYRLGLIYSLPDSPLHDPVKGRQTLERVASHPEGGLYSRQASLVLTLQLEISRLEQAAHTQASLAARLEDELGRLEEEAAQASSEAGEHQSRTRRLTAEIRVLRDEIARLTESLERRERELERIKEIDLGRVP